MICYLFLPFLCRNVLRLLKSTDCLKMPKFINLITVQRVISYKCYIKIILQECVPFWKLGLIIINSCHYCCTCLKIWWQKVFIFHEIVIKLEWNDHDWMQRWYAVSIIHHKKFNWLLNYYSWNSYGSFLLWSIIHTDYIILTCL